MNNILKDNTIELELCQQAKPYPTPRIEIINAEYGTSFLAASDPKPEVDDDDDNWADDDRGML